MLATELDHSSDLNSHPTDRTDGRTDFRKLADQVVPDVFVRYLRWRVSRLALALVPLARAADVGLHLAHIKIAGASVVLSRNVQLVSWLAGRAWHEVRFQSVRQFRVQRVRLWMLRRIAGAQGQEWMASAGRPVHVAAWISARMIAEARARAHRQIRLQRLNARLIRRAVVAQARSHARAAARPAVSPVQLRAALDRHEAWVASGWEVGKRADLHQVYMRGIDLNCALLSDADLHGADLDRADLHDADLEGADLRKTRLRRANLHRAALRWADLRQADLSNADLGEADLEDADLHRADLRGARLGQAVLVHADLRGANLARVKGLTQSQLDDASGDNETRLPRGLKLGRTSVPVTRR